MSRYEQLEANRLILPVQAEQLAQRVVAPVWDRECGSALKVASALRDAERLVRSLRDRLALLGHA